jgi:hypothetical protein
MKRLFELVAAVRQRFPKDCFFEDFEASLEVPVKRLHFARYEAALVRLKDDSWAILKKKCLAHYMDWRSGQIKQGFFNRLNEAFAYEYLVDEGHENVRFIKEDKTNKMPDIESIMKGRKRFCEVKSMGITDNEVFKRYGIGLPPRPNRPLDYARLGEPFFKKLGGALHVAKNQIDSVRGKGTVFILVRFDDICLDYFDNYVVEIEKFCRMTSIDSLVIKAFKHGELVTCWSH